MSMPPPTFRQALRVWIKIGLLSFGGPAGQIGLMQTELVEKRKWVSQERFLHALNYCMLLPGPEAQQLAIYIGWMLHRVRGGIVAGTLFVLPGAALLWGISYVYVRWSGLPWLAAVFDGLKPAVLAIVALAVIRIGKKILKTPFFWSVSAAAFVGIFVFGLPFPLIILGAGVLGMAVGRYRPGWCSAGTNEPPPAPSRIAAVSHRQSLAALGLWLFIWQLPVGLVFVIWGPGHVLFQEGVFFTKAALVTFGGAYAVLPYVAQQAVEVYQWLEPGQMLDGLGLAETTPGPLILVLQFVGFMGGWNQPGDLSPLAAATLAAGLTTWVTFVPGFLFIFAGAPYHERMRGNRYLNQALSTITAAIVGVILNLAVWFGLGILFPETTRVDAFALFIFATALTVLWRWKTDVMWVIAGAGAMGFLRHALLAAGG